MPNGARQTCFVPHPSGRRPNKEIVMKKFLQSFLRDESGQSLTEYALIIAVVSIGIIGALALFRDELGQLYTGIVDSINGA
jgi:Flp pilus assembly pilin Flp